MAGPHNNFPAGFPGPGQQRTQYGPGVPQPITGMNQQSMTSMNQQQNMSQQSMSGMSPQHQSAALGSQYMQNTGPQSLIAQQQMLQQQLQQQQQQQQQQLQQQQMQQAMAQQAAAAALAAAGAPQAPAVPVAPPPSKEFNTASLCRFGQETVQDIVSRTQEVFQTLKTLQPPNGTAQGANASNEKKAKVQEHLRTIRLLFKRLRLIYEKCNENCQGMEYTHIESLIPLKDDLDARIDEKKNSEAFRLAMDESREVTEQVIAKNKHLKEIIDHSRRIIWEINTMLTMRRS